MKKIALVAAISISLMGCASMQNEDGSTKKSAAYGGIGAAVGAVAGALLGHDNRAQGAAIGAALGGLAGAGYGHYADKQEAELKKSLAGTGVEVQRSGDDLKIVMPGNLTFPSGQSKLTPQADWELGKVAESLKQFPDTRVEIVGHTDSVGSDEKNLELSTERAISVGKFFTSNGVERSRIRAVGAGPKEPIASNSTEQGRAANRRVEIKLRAPTPEEVQKSGSSAETAS
jgi:outer membrane protein OmpA-like peptidoglycan-associated protein